MQYLILNNRDFSDIRVIDRDGEPWFVGKDICAYFGDSNPSRTLARVDLEDKEVTDIADALGRIQKTTIINESGLYSVLFAMQPQKANKDGVSDAYLTEIGNRIEKIRKFKHWITSEVLPQIRKTGTYSVAKTPTEMLVIMAQELDKQAKAMLEVKEDVKRLESKIMTVPNEYYTVAGYANLKGKRIDVTRANQIGRYAAKLSRKYGYEIGKVQDSRYGNVNSYHMDVLRDAFRGI